MLEEPDLFISLNNGGGCSTLSSVTSGVSPGVKRGQSIGLVTTPSTLRQSQYFTENLREPNSKIYCQNLRFSIIVFIFQSITFQSFPIGIRAPAPWAPVSSSTRLGVRVDSSETSSVFPSPGADTQTRTRGEQTHSGVIIIYKM